MSQIVALNLKFFQKFATDFHFRAMAFRLMFSLEKKEDIMNTLLKRTNGNGSTPTTTFSGLVDKIFQNNVKRLLDDDFWVLSNVSTNVSVPVNVRETVKS